MNSEFHDETAIDQGIAAASRSLADGHDVVQPDRESRELANKPKIVECRANLKTLADEREELLRLMRNTLPSVECLGSPFYRMLVVLLLMAAGLSFIHLAFAPFGFGLPGWIYSVGLAVVCAALGEYVLKYFGSPRFVGVLAAVAFLAGLTGLVMLANVRGDILVLYLKTALSEAGANAADAARFYEYAAPHLKTMFSLLAVALEIAITLLIWDAHRISRSPLAAAEQAKKRLAVVEQEMARLAARIVLLENEPAMFEAEFLRDFRRGLKHGVERRGRWRAMGIFGAAIAGIAIAEGQPSTVVVPDFTWSQVVPRAAGGQTEHQKNLNAAARLLSELPPATRFTVLGITEASFANPLMLLSGRIPDTPGPLELINQIDVARRRFAKQFTTAASRIQVTAKKTDILGATFMAREILRNGSPGKRNLIFLSDMRQSAAPLDIESPKVISTETAIATVEREHLLPDLRDVDVWVLGVDAAGKDIAYISSLRKFWTVFFAKAGANLRGFSMMRELPDLAAPRSPGDR